MILLLKNHKVYLKKKKNQTYLSSVLYYRKMKYFKIIINKLHIIVV